MGYIPHNVIIDHTMTVRYSAYGFSEPTIVNVIETWLAELPAGDSDGDGILNSDDNCPDVYNPEQTDTDGDGQGDACDEDDDNDGCLDEEDANPLVASGDTDYDGIADDCDPCDNLNVFVPGNVNGDVLNGEPLVDVLDIVEIVNHIVGYGSLSECGLEAGDVYVDGQYTILDVVNVVNIILGNATGGLAREPIGASTVSVSQGRDKTTLTFSTDRSVGGIEFVLDGAVISGDRIRLDEANSHLQLISSPVEEGTRVLIYDVTGRGAIMPLTVSIEGETSVSLSAVIIGSGEGRELSNYVLYVHESSALELPREITLYENYPNPFNPVTTISFSLPYETLVEIDVFNQVGQYVATVLRREYMAAGHHEILWNASDCSSGVYFIRMMTPEGVQLKKAILLK